VSKAVPNKGLVRCLALNEGATHLATGSMDRSVRVFDLSRLPEVGAADQLSPPHYDGVLAVAWCGSTLFSGSRDYSIKQYQRDDATGSWRLCHTVTGAHTSYVQALARLGPDHLLSGAAKGDFKVGMPPAAGVMGYDSVSVSVSPYSVGTHSVHWCAHLDPRVQIWNVSDCTVVQELPGHSLAVNALCHGGTRLFSASSDKQAKIWVTAGATRSGTPQPETQGSLPAPAEVTASESSAAAASEATDGGEASPPSPIKRQGTFTITEEPVAEGDEPATSDPHADEEKDTTPAAEAPAAQEKSEDQAAAAKPESEATTLRRSKRLQSGQEPSSGPATALADDDIF
jgi:hypothetical protein